VLFLLARIRGIPPTVAVWFAGVSAASAVVVSVTTGLFFLVAFGFASGRDALFLIVVPLVCLLAAVGTVMNIRFINRILKRVPSSVPQPPPPPAA
jgi:hypothetical protein